MSSPHSSSPAGRIDRTIEKIQQENRVGLMAHLVLGYPSLGASRSIVEVMVRSGVDMVEVQLPFSDPTADGPTITLACHQALKFGMKVADGIQFVAEMTRTYEIPFVLMSYYNLIFNYRSSGEEARGLGSFARSAAAAGVSGLIVPDLPPDEAQEGYPEACRENGLHPIYVLSPNVGEKRLRAIQAVAGGFLYSTSRTGTTGKEMELELTQLGGFLAEARKICGLPLAVGFSISRREQIQSLRGHAEIAVVGSHLIRTHERYGLSGLERELRKLSGRKD